jgi:glutathione S-transferase
MLKLYTSKLPDGGEALKPRINDELTRHLGYIEKSLEGVNWFVGNTFSGADVQLSFIAEIAPMMYSVDKLPNLMAFRNRCHERPAYQRAIAKTDFYAYGPKN